MSCYSMPWHGGKLGRRSEALGERSGTLGVRSETLGVRSETLGVRSETLGVRSETLEKLNIGSTERNYYDHHGLNLGLQSHNITI